MGPKSSFLALLLLVAFEAMSSQAAAHRGK